MAKDLDGEAILNDCRRRQQRIRDIASLEELREQRK